MAASKRRRAAVVGIPAVIAGLLTLVALWRIGQPEPREPGSAGTIGIDADRHASLERVEVRQLTSTRTFWAGERDQDPVFVVMDSPVPLEPGARVTITGRVEAAPDVDVARREWQVNDATARAVHQRGVYVRALEIKAVP